MDYRSGAILYARVSTDEQLLEALRDYAAREGYEVLEEVVDSGQSGASLERAGMDRVRDLVAGSGVYVVPAQDRDRFAREPAYHYLLRRKFEGHRLYKLLRITVIVQPDTTLEVSGVFGEGLSVSNQGLVS
jgi:DNA invertase Pin-like site-specific DNA recombinase